MTDYRVVDGIASTPKGQQLYTQAVANQNARDLMNAQHTVNISAPASERYPSGSSGAVGVSNRPYTHPKYGKFTKYATQKDLIERGFPTVDGIVTPVTEQQAEQQGMSSDGKGANYVHFWKQGGSPQLDKQTTQAVLDRQEIYRQITGKPTFAFHGCHPTSSDMCPQWSPHHGRLGSLVKVYTRRKLNNQPVETSDTMFQGLPIGSPQGCIGDCRSNNEKKKASLVQQMPDKYRYNKWGIAELIPEPEPEPEPEIIAEPVAYSLPLIAGVVIVIIIILRGKKNA